MANKPTEQKAKHFFENLLRHDLLV